MLGPKESRKRGGSQRDASGFSGKTLKLWRESLRSIFENAPAGVFLSTVAGKLLCVNATAARLFGYASAEEFLAGITDIEKELFVYPEQRQRLLREVLACNHFVGAEVSYRRRDGSVFLANLRMRAARDKQDEPVFLEGFVEDITERKRVEAALQQSEARYRMLIEQAPLPIGISRNGITVYVNQKYLELFRCRNAEAQVGRPIREFWAPEQRDFIDELPRRSSQGLPIPTNFEGVAQREDGSQFPLQVAICIVELPDGPARLAFFTDITELKEAEAELKRYQGHLEELVAVRTADLKAANGELEAFSYSVSHDLRAPLRTINGYAQILLRSHASSVPEASQNMLKEIMHQAQRMDQLIKDLLAFSRVGRQAMQSVLIDMDALAHEVFTEQSTAQPNTKAQIRFNPLPPAFGDRAMIRVVLNNLFSNALKYSRNRDPALIEVGGSTQEGQNVYFVKDNGAGFDMQYADQLFEVFQRLHDKDEFEGTGVGLAMVHRIIQRHGGRIWAEGKVDEGATFSFSLPARAANT